MYLKIKFGIDLAELKWTSKIQAAHGSAETLAY